jgi:hypothetical protein
MRLPLLILHPPWLLPTYPRRWTPTQAHHPQNNVVAMLRCPAPSVEGSLNSGLVLSTR